MQRASTMSLRAMLSFAQRSSPAVGNFQAVRGFASAGSAVVNVKTDEDFKTILKEVADKQQLAIVDFTAAWCGPCRAVAPIYDKLSNENPAVKFLKVDIDTEALNGTVADHMISAVPTFVVYKGAQKVESFTGARVDMLTKVLKAHQ